MAGAAAAGSVVVVVVAAAVYLWWSLLLLLLQIYSQPQCRIILYWYCAVAILCRFSNLTLFSAAAAIFGRELLALGPVSDGGQAERCSCHFASWHAESFRCHGTQMWSQVASTSACKRAIFKQDRDLGFSMITCRFTRHYKLDLKVVENVKHFAVCNDGHHVIQLPDILQCKLYWRPIWHFYLGL